MSNKDADYTKYRAKELVDRNVDTLVGLAYGVTADGIVNQKEAEFIRSWLVRNQDSESALMRKMRRRLGEMLDDGVLDASEAEELLGLFHRFTGKPDLDEAAKTSTLPVCNPAPRVNVEGRVFCFTGRAAYGARSECEAEIKARGGEVISGITKKLDYLVLGEYVTPAWMHETHGRKIEKAIEYREKFSGLPKIITERHWLTELGLY